MKLPHLPPATMVIDKSSIKEASSGPIQAAPKGELNLAGLKSARPNVTEDLLAGKSFDIVRIELQENPVTGHFSKSVLFEGRTTGLIIPESEKTQRMQSLIDRVELKAGQGLVDSGLLDDEGFLDFAATLSDTELNQFANAALALQTPAKLNFFYAHGSAKSQIESFMTSLAEMDGETRAKALDKAAELSAKVPVNSPGATYLSNGTLPIGSLAANDIHNFVHALGTLNNSHSLGEASALIDKLNSFDSEQQAGLLQLIGSDVELGQRLMNSLENFGKDAQDKAINYLSELSKSRWPIELTAKYASTEENRAGAVLGYDDRGLSVVMGMIEDVISLSENYVFSDQQFEDMFSQLESLDSTHQRAYIAISKTALETLSPGSAEQPVVLVQQQELMDTLDNLRGSSTVRELVSKSRMGEARSIDGQTYYDFKDINVGKQDQRQTIEVLATEAWLNRGDESRGLMLAAKLDGLTADARDDLIDRLDALKGQGDTDKAMANTAGDVLNTQYQGFLSRSNGIHHSSDIEGLFSAEQALAAPVQEKFWQASELLEESLDTMVAVLEATSTGPKELVVEFVHSLAESAKQNMMTRQQAKEMAIELLDLVAKTVTEPEGKLPA